MSFAATCPIAEAPWIIPSYRAAAASARAVAGEGVIPTVGVLGSMTSPDSSRRCYPTAKDASWQQIWPSHCGGTGRKETQAFVADLRGPWKPLVRPQGGTAPAAARQLTFLLWILTETEGPNGLGREVATGGSVTRLLDPNGSSLC